MTSVRRILKPSRSGGSSRGVSTADMIMRDHLSQSRHAYMVDSDDEQDLGQGAGDAADEGDEGGSTDSGEETPMEYYPPPTFPPAMPTEFVPFPQYPCTVRGESSSNPRSVPHTAQIPVFTQSQDSGYYPHEAGRQTQYDSQDRASQSQQIEFDMLQNLLRAEISPLPPSGSTYHDPYFPPASGQLGGEFQYPRRSYDTPPPYAQGASSSLQPPFLPDLGRRSLDTRNPRRSPVPMQYLEDELEVDARLPRARSHRGRRPPTQQAGPQRAQTRDHSVFGRVYGLPPPCGTDPRHRHGR